MLQVGKKLEKWSRSKASREGRLAPSGEDTDEME